MTHSAFGRKKMDSIFAFRPSPVRHAERRERRKLAVGICLSLAVVLFAATASAQSGSTVLAAPDTSSAAQQAASASAAPLTLTLQDALDRARRYSPQFQAAATAAKMAHENRIQARASLLPSADYTMQDLTTQGNGVLPSGRYVTNDGVHVYRAWGVFHQGLSLNTFTRAGYHAAQAAEAVARAQEEIARRGLNVAVTQAYYGLVVAERKYATAQQSLDQAKNSLHVSRELEQGGEVAHSDVITFQIQANQAQQAFQESKLAMDNARLSLAVMLFPDFNQNFNVVDDLDTTPSLPSLDEMGKLARQNNPEIRAAMAGLREANSSVSVAKAAFLPSVSLDVDYGIESNSFALRSTVSAFPEAGKLPNLGFFMTASLNLPVWHWGELRSKLHQAQDQRDLARVNLSYAQRQLFANLYADYNDAQTSQSEINSLRNSASLAADSLRLNMLRYKAGDATVLEVLNAQTTLTQAKDAYANGLARYRIAIAQLQTITGSF